MAHIFENQIWNKQIKDYSVLSHEQPSQPSIIRYEEGSDAE